MGREHYLNVIAWNLFSAVADVSPSTGVGPGHTEFCLRMTPALARKPPTVFCGALPDTPRHMEPSEIFTAIFTDLFQPQFSRIHVHGQCGGRL